MTDLKQKRLFLLDMDGTIYLDDDLFDGTLDFLNYVRSVGGRYMFLTNNSSKSVDKYIEKLAKLGIESTKEDFLTSTNATIVHLKKKNYHKIYGFGTTTFRQQLLEAGLPITDKLEDDIDCLCMGFDTELSFKKLEDACILLGRGVDYVATNPDWVCPTWYGSVPDCGSVSQMLFNATKRMPLFIGKPQPAMVNLALEESGYAPETRVEQTILQKLDLLMLMHLVLYVRQAEHLLWDADVSRRQSTRSIQILRAVSKPIVSSLQTISLSIVPGRATQGIP